MIDRSAGVDRGFVLRSAGPHVECMNGHLLSIAGMTSSFSHSLNTHATYCVLCTEMRLDRHAWVSVDHTVVRREDEPENPRTGIEFVACPPQTPAGIGLVLQQHFVIMVV